MDSRHLKVSLAVLVVTISAVAGAATRTATAPKTMLDLSHFNLTLPIDSSGGSKGAAATVQNWQLAGSPGYSSQYFYTDSDGAVVFYAPSNGATTTPGVGSDHTRTELRELYKVPGPTEWTNNIGGTMTATCRVNKVAAKSDEAVVGQIHGLSAMMLLLDYNPIKNQIEAKVYATPTSTKPQLAVLASNVSLGTKFSYSIQWIGATLSITVNGRTTNWTVDSSWNKVPVYFKAGAYSGAPNTGNPSGDATEVAFYSLNIQH